MIRDKRIKRRKQRLLLFVAVALSLLAFILHRQITERVFSPLIPGAYYHVETEKKVVALTFDAVWEPGEIGRILDTLDRYHVRSTFFFTGSWLRYNSDLAREIVLRGHEIGHHGYSHKRLTELSDEELAKEFEQAEEALQEELNMTVGLFRPPFGDVDERVIDFASARGYTTVLWSIDPHDWLDPGVDKIISRVMKSAHRGAIILFHSNATQSAEALPVIIQSLTMQEYELIPFSEMLESAR